MAPLKILIVGGGITGPCLGYWLSKTDCEVTILERSPDLRASGQQIDIRGQGLTCMRRMGIEPQIREKLVDEQGIRFIDQKGKIKAEFGANKTGQGKQSFTAEYEIMRGDLVRILYGATKDNCRYIFGQTVEDFEQRENGVHVKFSDGKEEDFDLLVGADGQSSRTRRKMLGTTLDDDFEWLGLYLCYFTVPRTEKDENFAVALNLPGRRVVATRVDNPKTMQVYLAKQVTDRKAGLQELNDAMASGDQQKVKEVYADMFKDVGWECPRLLDGMLHSEEAKDFYNQRIGQVKMSGSWTKGRVTLVGDAAYCPSPITGVGTSVGIVGAYALA
jgi:2-polyprenyl-6-methoxyphenol hydroxylase-like FAD-dependent oxidoreductase